MSAQEGGRPRRSAQRTGRDRRRRALGQNFLVDRPLISRLVRGFDLGPQELVVEIGAGTGALTVPMARTGAEIVAVEADPVWADRLRRRLRDDVASPHRVRVVCADALALQLPEQTYRVVSNLPFGITTDVLGRLLDDPERGPERADVIVQLHVARKHATAPPTALRTAAWTPWWTFELGTRIGSDAFRPRPAVDAAVLVVRRRDPPILPARLAPRFREALRPLWEDGAVRRPSRGTRRRRG